MVTADIRLPRAELTNNPQSALHPILVTDMATRAKPLIDGLANNRRFRELAPPGLPPDHGGLASCQLELSALHTRHIDIRLAGGGLSLRRCA